MTTDINDQVAVTFIAREFTGRGLQLSFGPVLHYRCAPWGEFCAFDGESNMVETYMDLSDRVAAHIQRWHTRLDLQPFISDVVLAVKRRAVVDHRPYDPERPMVFWDLGAVYWDGEGFIEE